MATLADNGDIDGIPIIHRTIIETWMVAAYAYAGGTVAVNLLYRSDYVNQVKLARRLGTTEPTWMPQAVDSSLDTTRPSPNNDQNFLTVGRLFDLVVDAAGKRNWPRVESLTRDAYRHAYGLASHTAVHGTFLSVIGHRTFLAPGSPSPIPIRLPDGAVIPAGTPLSERMMFLTRDNNVTHAFQPVVAVAHSRDLTWELAAATFHLLGLDASALERLVSVEAVPLGPPTT